MVEKVHWRDREGATAPCADCERWKLAEGEEGADGRYENGKCAEHGDVRYYLDGCESFSLREIGNCADCDYWDFTHPEAKEKDGPNHQDWGVCEKWKELYNYEGYCYLWQEDGSY